MRDRIHAALKAWRALLDAEDVITDPGQLSAAATATFPTTQRIPAIIRPSNLEQVQECLKIAGRHKTPLYPISTGKNWGYGSRVPIESGCAILDLSRLNQITDYDDNLGYVTVEPGVTQGQLSDFLKQHGGKFRVDVTGSSPDCSVIGNTLERGFGHSPYADHFAYVSTLQVVLPNGDCVHTGFGRFTNAKAAPVFRWGVGPHVDGLFSQSNLGVVTRMTVWLMPTPECFQAVYFSIDNDEALVELINTLRPLRLRGTIKSALHIANDYRVLASLQQYPWAETGGQTPLPRPILQALSERWGFGAWNGSGALYGNRHEVREARKQVKRVLRGKVKKLRFVDDRLLALAERFQGPLTWLTRIDIAQMLSIVRPVHEMLKGTPTDRFIESTYWRKKEPPPTLMDPDRDGCGLIWCSPVSPTDGKHALEMTEIVQNILPKHGFEPSMTMTLLTARCMDNVIGIAYDRDIDGEDERAIACYHELVDALTRRGFYPYRLGHHSAKLLPPSSDDSDSFLRTLKQALDPDGILAPGRYV